MIGQNASVYLRPHPGLKALLTPRYRNIYIAKAALLSVTVGFDRHFPPSIEQKTYPNLCGHTRNRLGTPGIIDELPRVNVCKHIFDTPLRRHVLNK